MYVGSSCGREFEYITGGNFGCGFRNTAEQSAANRTEVNYVTKLHHSVARQVPFDCIDST